jgi:hypothetical protein
VSLRVSEVLGLLRLVILLIKLVRFVLVLRLVLVRRLVNVPNGEGSKLEKHLPPPDSLQP